MREYVKAKERTRLLLLKDSVLIAECEIDLLRASGAGGQKRNKTSSAVRMRHPCGVVARASESRSQTNNRRKALVRLRVLIALDLRCVLPVNVSEGAKQAIKRGPMGKNAKTRNHADYLLALAEILDIFLHHKAALAPSAALLGVSTSSFGKLLRGDERLARRVAEMRSQHGLKALHG